MRRIGRHARAVAEHQPGLALTGPVLTDLARRAGDATAAAVRGVRRGLDAVGAAGRLRAGASGPHDPARAQRPAGALRSTATRGCLRAGRREERNAESENQCARADHGIKIPAGSESDPAHDAIETRSWARPASAHDALGFSSASSHPWLRSLINGGLWTIPARAGPHGRKGVIDDHFAGDREYYWPPGGPPCAICGCPRLLCRSASLSPDVLGRSIQIRPAPAVVRLLARAVAPRAAAAAVVHPAPAA
jgi:hypothetical protein